MKIFMPTISVLCLLGASCGADVVGPDDNPTDAAVAADALALDTTSIDLLGVDQLPGADAGTWDAHAADAATPDGAVADAVSGLDRAAVVDDAAAATDDAAVSTDAASNDIGPYEGYTLFNPNGQRQTLLIDMQGQTVHTWNNAISGGYSVYLLDNGNILRPAQAPGAQLSGGASAGLIQEIDWDGNVVWEFEYNSSTYLTHHDLEPMPNGNILAIAWETKTAVESAAAGRDDNAALWPDHLIEVDPSKPAGQEIVWRWHAWDHLVQDADPSADNYGVVADHPELLDVNLGEIRSGPPGGGSRGGDWLHINGVSYNAETDQIVISSHFMDEVYVIDHSTANYQDNAAGIAAAAGHTGGNSGKGGDILFRWGNPANYGAVGDHVIDVVHCSLWIPQGLPGAGNILLFNNGETSHASSVLEIVPPIDGSGHYVLAPGTAYGPAAASWSYSNGTTFYSSHLGGNQRLPNGNTLLTESTDRKILEVSPAGEVLWEYSYSREIARSLRYPADHPGLSQLP